MIKNSLRKNKAITLVTLVITIIILLILAGVSIVTLTESGLFEKARLAEQKSKNAQEKEQDILRQYENQIVSSREYESKIKELEQEINRLKNGVELYNGEAISTGTFEISDNIGDYKYIKIYYSNGKMLEVEVIDSKVKATLTGTAKGVYSGENYISITTDQLSIEQKTATISNSFQGLIYQNSNKTFGQAKGNISIYKIIGYK